MGLLTGLHRGACAALAFALGTACGPAPAAAAPDLTLSIDLRATLADVSPSFLDGGLGKFRSSESGLSLGRLRLALEQPIGESVLLHLDASSWGDGDRNPVDLTEAFVELRPVPRGAWRTRLRAGLFYAPSSLENRAPGWESPYSISFSALNSWLAEEIRSIGIEGSFDHLGRLAGGDQDFGAFFGLYGWNDPAGVLVANHGFALHDRQTALFGRVGVMGLAPIQNRQLFHEIDGRPGYYAGLRWRWRDRLEARAMHYDNRADVSKTKPSVPEVAWLTRFDTVGLRAEAGEHLTLIAQHLAGDTEAFVTGRLYWKFATWYALANVHRGAHGLTLRYDDFRMRILETPFGPPSLRDDGTGWTLAWIFEPLPSRWRVALEASRVQSRATNRPSIGLPPLALESRLELSLRYRFESRRGLE